MSDEDSEDDQTTGVAEVTDEEEGEARPRRRGSRGGRGRRRNGVESEPSEVAAPPPPPPRTAAVESPVERKPRPEPRRTPLLFRRDVEHEPRVERPVELEPPPRSYEEDLEEVGRPEGPHEELHVDPYAWEGDAAPRHATDESPEEDAPAVERGSARAERSNEPQSMTIEQGTDATYETELTRDFEHEPTREPQAERESEVTREEEEEPWLDRTRPASPEPPTTPPGPHYGRRPGRSRR
jgi:hypothetical protein